jgi:hypothetical protein
MIIIEFYDGQGLGNQLWNYTVLRTVSRKLNLPFVVLSRDRFKGKLFLNIDYGEVDQIEEILHKINNNEIRYFKERMYFDLELQCFTIDFDEKILNLKPYTKIDGYFQSEKYFFDDYNYFKTLFSIKLNLLDEKFIDKNVCVLNIRGGEYKGNKELILPKIYWINAMKNMRKKFNINNFLIVTDDEKYSKALFPDILISKKGIAENYIALHQANYLIISNSSFAYFPIKTKTKKPFVIAPMYWARYNNIFERWASPANLYLDWNWQDDAGNIKSYNECLDLYKDNMRYYHDNYNIMVEDNIRKYTDKFSIKIYTLRVFKKIIKAIFPAYLIKKIISTIR